METKQGRGKKTWKPDVDFHSPLKNSQIRSGVVSEKCLDEKFLLTRKIRRCGKSLKSVRQGQFHPQQISLTYYGVEGEMGVSWVTFDGLVVRSARYLILVMIHMG